MFNIMSSHASLYGNVRKECSFQTRKLKNSAVVEIIYTAMYGNVSFLLLFFLMFVYLFFKEFHSFCFYCRSLVNFLKIYYVLLANI